jgi:hypothetical protein
MTLLTLAERIGMELALLAAFGYWGFKTGGSTGMRWLLGLGAPLLAAVVWALWMAPKANHRLQGTAFLLVELVLFGLAGWALYSTGQKNLTLWLGVVYVINRVWMVVWKQ